jgi:hypothetical protein
LSIRFPTPLSEGTNKEKMMSRIPHGLTALSEAASRAPETAHNPTVELNLKNALPCLSAPTHFDYMFPTLQSEPDALLPETEQTVANLKRLGRAMSESGRARQLDSATPAAYTYFGQFLDHEITYTLEAVPGSMPSLNDPSLAPLPLATVREKIRNGRSSKLDLDCVYGSLLHSNPEFRDGDRMLLGRVSETGNRPPGKDDLNDLNRRPPSNDPEIDRTAIIGDPRNDENLIVAQLHVAFLRAHNALIDRGHSFAEASLLLRQHFQWLVVHDFLNRIADPEIVTEILARGRNLFYTPPAGELFMPLEFSVAAYRFGHSMVRNVYRYNLNFPQATLGQLFRLTALSGNINPTPGSGFDSLPENWIIEWEDFLDGGRNMARRLDTHLTEPLSELRDFAGNPLPDEAILSVRNLLRGYMLRVPTGQAAAIKLGLQPMTAREIEMAVGQEQAQILRETGFSNRTPLWYYILAESANHLPDHLGPVGSTIVAEVLIELVRRSEDSILSQKNWRPTLGAVPGRFTLRDLLRLAGVQGAKPMLIIEKVRQRKSELKANRAEAKKNSERAVAAVQAGIRSKAWKAYMEQFADTPEQLMRLMGTDGTLGDKELDRNRAYLVANAVCGAGSTDTLDMGVETIDN